MTLVGHPDVAVHGERRDVAVTAEAQRGASRAGGRVDDENAFPRRQPEPGATRERRAVTPGPKAGCCDPGHPVGADAEKLVAAREPDPEQPAGDGERPGSGHEDPAGDDELRAEAARLRESLFRLNFKLALGEVDAIKRIRQEKKALARIQTLSTQRATQS